MATRHHTSAHVCRHCGDTFAGRKKKFCSITCRDQATRIKKTGRLLSDPLTCEHCGSGFTGRKRKYCTTACSQAAQDGRKVERGIKGFTGRKRRQPNPIVDGARVCLDCERNLLIANFPECRHAKSGRRGVCSECWRVYSRVKRQAEKAISLSVDREMRAALNRRGGSSKVERLCGYTVADLRLHLERQFIRGMSWARFDEIHIDHIVPRAEFDLSSEDEWRACWALSNLQPRWAKDNQSKGAKRQSLL